MIALLTYNPGQCSSITEVHAAGTVTSSRAGCAGLRLVRETPAAPSLAASAPAPAEARRRRSGTGTRCQAAFTSVAVGRHGRAPHPPHSGLEQARGPGLASAGRPPRLVDGALAAHPSAATSASTSPFFTRLVPYRRRSPLAADRPHGGDACSVRRPRLFQCAGGYDALLPHLAPPDFARLPRPGLCPRVAALPRHHERLRSEPSAHYAISDHRLLGVTETAPPDHVYSSGPTLRTSDRRSGRDHQPRRIATAWSCG